MNNFRTDHIGDAVAETTDTSDGAPMVGGLACRPPALDSAR